MPAQVKVCRGCGEEYRLDAVSCADCDGELEVRQLDESGAVLGPEGGDEETSDTQRDELLEHRVVFVTPRAADLVPLAEALRDDGIAYRLAEQPAGTGGGPSRYALLVPDDEAKAALSTLAPLIAPHEEPDEVQGVEARFEPERGYVQCPACGADQIPGAVECAACGLGLGLGVTNEAETSCAHCGAALSDTDTTCTTCGRPHQDE